MTISGNRTLRTQDTSVPRHFDTSRHWCRSVRTVRHQVTSAPSKVRTDLSTQFGSNPILIDRIRIELAARSNPILIVQMRTTLDRAVDFSERFTAFTTGRACTELPPASILQRAQCSHCKRYISYGNSVRPSVRPSHAGIVSKRRHVARCSLHRWIAKCV